MKRVLLLLVLLMLSASAFAQTPGQTTQIRPANTLPATCDPTKGHVVFVPNDGIYQCTATNTWTKPGGSGIGTYTTSTLPPVAAEGTLANLTDGQRDHYCYKNGRWRPCDLEVDVRDFGAAGDTGWYPSCSIGAGNKVITVGNSAWINGSNTSVGAKIAIEGANTGGTRLVSTIVSFNGTNQFTIADAAIQSSSGKACWWGTSVDDTQAFQNAVNYCNAFGVFGGCAINATFGQYTASNINIPAAAAGTLRYGSITIKGAGRHASWIYGIGADNTAIFNVPANGVSTTISDFGFQSADYLNKTQWAVFWNGGTYHAFLRNYVTEMRGMVQAANTWINTIAFNGCYVITANCIEFGGLNTGPVNATRTIFNELSNWGTSGHAYYSHTNSASYGNTFAFNSLENSNPPFAEAVDSSDNHSIFQFEYAEINPSVSGYTAIFRGTYNKIDYPSPSCVWMVGGNNLMTGRVLGSCPSQTYMVKNDGTFNNYFGIPSNGLSAMNSASVFGGVDGMNLVAGGLNSWQYAPGGIYDFTYGKVGIAGRNYYGSASDHGNPNKPTNFGTSVVINYGEIVQNLDMKNGGTDGNAFWMCNNNPTCSMNPIVASQWLAFGFPTARRIFDCTGAPSSGTYNAGDFCKNTNPTNAVQGWVYNGTTWLKIVASVSTENWSASTYTASASSITPTQATSAPLFGWYKADDGGCTVDGTNTAAWNDSSGNANNLARNAGTISCKLAIINGKPVYRFNASGAFRVSGTLGAATTTFIVYRKTAGTGGGQFMFDGWNGNAGRLIFANNAGGSSATNMAIESNNFTFTTSITIVDDGNGHIARSNFNGASSYLAQDGTNGPTGNPGNTSMGGVVVGAASTGSGTVAANWSGDIAEVIVFNGVLSAGEQQGIDLYLSQKYAITISDPPIPYQSTGFSVDNLGNVTAVGAKIGSSGTLLSKVAKYTASLTPAAVAANTCAEQTFTVTGIGASDVILTVNKPTAQAGLGIAGWRSGGANTLAINFCNNTAGAITPTAAETYSVLVAQ